MKDVPSYKPRANGDYPPGSPEAKAQAPVDGIEIRWDAQQQVVVLRFDSTKFRTWDYVVGVLTLAVARIGTPCITETFGEGMPCITVFAPETTKQLSMTYYDFPLNDDFCLCLMMALEKAKEFQRDVRIAMMQQAAMQRQSDLAMDHVIKQRLLGGDGSPLRRE
jgi:hypothetical protein